VERNGESFEYEKINKKRNKRKGMQYEIIQRGKKVARGREM
jgi:hypothetical protein